MEKVALTKLFNKLLQRFKLTPANQPNQVRYLPARILTHFVDIRDCCFITAIHRTDVFIAIVQFKK